jgi:hypothetical protein
VRERSFTPAELAEMTTPSWELAKQALAAGELDRAIELIDVAAARARSLQEYSVNWIASLLSFVGRELGEEAVERALRRTGDELVRPRRDVGPPWASLPVSARAKAVARAMVANGSACEVSEDDEKVGLSFRCGSGGYLIDSGSYDGDDGYLVLRERAGRTFMRDELPVYCAHCAVHNELLPLEWGGVPVSIEHPPRAKGEPCVHHLYKDPAALPDEAHRRLGR